MAVMIESPQAQSLSCVADLYESVIGGFWQDLTAMSHWDDDVAEDELAMDLFELAEASGLRWPVHVPQVPYTRKGRKLVLSCSPEQAAQLLQLYVDVCTGRWRTVAETAQSCTPGELDPAVKRSLGSLQRRMQVGDEHQVAVAAARQIIEQLRQMP